MNWRRGLTRIYVLLWLGLAGLGVYVAGYSSEKLVSDHKKVGHFLRDYPNETMTGSRRYAAYRENPTNPSTRPEGFVETPQDTYRNWRLGEVLVVVESQEFKHPVVAHSKICGTCQRL